ncbi:Type IV fimbrial assembly, ATPase PilB [hydrothermal vent metagenome]|uniref:Type IV fimbrial assembly, ATPase PilB n=1 Tax=hydrothermal vent metagenome TaxID=652676 RepID=A0A3B1DBZ0_9ZZZZ
MKNKQKIGELLVDLNILTQEDLDRALQEQKHTGERLGATLLKMELLSEEDLDYLLGRQFDIPSINLENYNPSPDLLATIPEKVIRKYQVLPLSIEDKSLTVATASPRDLILMDDLSYITGFKIAPVVTSITTLERKIEELFQKPVSWEESLKVNDTEDLEIIKGDTGIVEEDLEDALESAEEAPVIKLVNAVILAAIEEEATHIHIEPREDSHEIYLRIDGKLKLLVKPPANLQHNVVNRLKILSSIDILKRFLPAEGFFRAKSKGRYYDIDAATIPSLHGERMVLTFQQPFSKEELQLEKLGFTPETLYSFKELLSSPRGFILVTGPSDSGKSSTIYAALNHLKSPEKSIFTFERTVKNKLSGINQGQPNEKFGYSYEKGLQSLLRQDMDVLMAGEMMTREAVVSALHASLSKTLVLGRFLCNDTIGAISLIMDMDVPPFMFFSSLTAILGQRLIRRLCQECIEDYDPPAGLAEEIQVLTGTQRPRLFRSRGCPACGLTGYNHRIALFELLVPSKELREAILAKVEPSDLKEVAGKQQYHTFRQDGLIKAAEGLTSYEEVVRII